MNVEHQMTEAEAEARRHEPSLWSWNEPDLSAMQERQRSLIRARERLGQIWWNPETENYEDVK